MLSILHQDNHIVVLDKPTGLSVLPEGWEPRAPYLKHMLEEKYGKAWVVHRLDKVTSGVMVIALTAEAHRELNRQFEKHEVEKIYQAIIEGIPPWDERTARHMLKTNVGRKHRTIVVHQRGKNSETEFKVIKRGNNLTQLEAYPMTGRTHQIRVHLSALGYPILGDKLYGAKDNNLINRPALHACSLTIVHPITGKKTTFTSVPPIDYQDVLNHHVF